jgi:hypothetical protein
MIYPTDTLQPCFSFVDLIVMVNVSYRDTANEE